jgi:hypothetical protein
LKGELAYKKPKREVFPRKFTKKKLNNNYNYPNLNVFGVRLIANFFARVENNPFEVNLTILGVKSNITINGVITTLYKLVLVYDYPIQTFY